MSKQQEYEVLLAALGEWEPFLVANSGLPGPRANLELAWAAARTGTLEQFRRFAGVGLAQAPVNSPAEFLPVIGAMGLGRLIGAGQHALLTELRPMASDPRWRTREGVAMALQFVGDADPGLLVAIADEWSQGNRLEQRAAVAGVAEPRLLREGPVAGAALVLLDRVTSSLAESPDRRSEEYRTLRQALGYAWSVVVVAAPEEGKARMERWLASTDPDVQWVMRENLKKNRLRALDAAWVERWSRPR